MTQLFYTGRGSGLAYPLLLTRASSVDDPLLLYREDDIALLFYHPCYLEGTVHSGPRPDGSPLRFVLDDAMWFTVELRDEQGPLVGEPSFWLAYEVWNQAEEHREEWDAAFVWNDGERVYRSTPIDPAITLGVGDLKVPGFLPERVTWQKKVGHQDLGTVRLRRGHSLHVEVRDASGAPVRDAKVTIRRSAEGAPLQPHLSPYTDAEGRVSIAGLDARFVVVRVERRGYREYTGRQTLKRSETNHAVRLREDRSK